MYDLCSTQNDCSTAGCHCGLLCCAVLLLRVVLLLLLLLVAEFGGTASCKSSWRAAVIWALFRGCPLLATAAPVHAAGNAAHRSRGSGGGYGGSSGSRNMDQTMALHAPTTSVPCYSGDARVVQAMACQAIACCIRTPSGCGSSVHMHLPPHLPAK